MEMQFTHEEPMYKKLIANVFTLSHSKENRVAAASPVAAHWAWDHAGPIMILKGKLQVKVDQK